MRPCGSRDPRNFVPIIIRSMTRPVAPTQTPPGLLGDLSREVFLRRHWQKRPLLVRDAIPDCGHWLQPATLFELASRDEVASRLVMRVHGRWSVRHGPFQRSELRRLPSRGWTLLVQGVEQHLRQASDLLQFFSFIPHARLDDLMVSYAPPGGGVGPHFDSYDVFLLQGAGTRRWRISAQKDLDLIENAPLRILKNFRHTQEWNTAQGDLLYLPPRYAHDGVATEACMTLSVGFRAPRKQELASRFLEFLQDELSPSGKPDALYTDHDLQLQQHPAELSAAMLTRISHALRQIRWDERDVQQFAGRYLSEPAAQTVFIRPRRAAALPAFARHVAAKGLRLALPTRMLFRGNAVFINGENHPLPARDRAAIVRLADRREVPAFMPSSGAAHLLYAWYCAGYVELC